MTDSSADSEASINSDDGEALQKMRLTEGLLIALFPVAAYAFSFAYISGYADYFGIPTEYISVSLESCFIAGAALAGVALVLFTFANSITLFFISKMQRGYLFNYGLVLVLVWMAAAVMTGFQGRLFWQVTGIYSFMLVTNYGFPALYTLKSGSYLDHLEEQDRREAKTLANKTLYGTAMKRMSKTAYNCALGLVIFLPLTNSFGHTVARFQQHYLMTSKDPHLVQILKSGDAVLFRQLSPNGKRLLPSLVIKDSKALAEETLIMTRLDNLVVEPSVGDH